MLAVTITVGALGFLFACIGVYFAGRAYGRQGTVHSALDTIKILQAQVEALSASQSELKTENASLRTEVGLLRGQVTQAAPVRELAEWLKGADASRTTAISEMRSVLDRIERKISTAPSGQE